MVLAGQVAAGRACNSRCSCWILKVKARECAALLPSKLLSFRALRGILKRSCLEGRSQGAVWIPLPRTQRAVPGSWQGAQCCSGSRGIHGGLPEYGGSGRERWAAVWNDWRRGMCRGRGGGRVSAVECLAEAAAKEEEEIELSAVEGKLGRVEELEELVQYFIRRKISKKTLEASGVMRYGGAIAFLYKQRDGRIVSCKFRDSHKRFWQAKGGKKVFYGLDGLEKDAKEVVIVEGEMDKLSMDEAGIPNCLSVPDGAPAVAAEVEAEVKDPIPGEDREFGYLWECREFLEKATKIVLATDDDEPGQALAEELARRLGRERCWRVRWPAAEGGVKVKDANDMLRLLGKDALREAVKKAEMMPIRGLFHYSEFSKEIDDYYYLRLGDERGVTTGWQGLNDYYRVVPGELTVVTGVPNSGKSEWIDALLCNLNQQRRWRFALCSMENKVREHARKLLEKRMGKPFFDAPYSRSVPRMSPEELAAGMAWLEETFVLIRCEDDQLPSVDWVLKLAKAAVLRHGIRGLVIDPYNELDHQRPGGQTETEYVSQMLTKVKRFAQHHDCHVWFVAHPKQLAAWKGNAPNLYDIAGSAHFINKCDNGLVIHRNRDPDSGPVDGVQVLVKKVRNKAAGTIGQANLAYDRVTGQYTDVEPR